MQRGSSSWLLQTIAVLGVHLIVVTSAPTSGSCRNSAANPCSLTGGGSTYTETIVGDTRKIVSAGCPNNNPVTVCVGSNPNPANTQGWKMDVPATPRFHKGTYAESLADAVPLARVGGLIGLTINGVEIRGCWGGSSYPTCTDYASSATANEGDTFEYCRGHGNPYHYHEAPICLLQQMGPRADGISPLIGWAADGFPVYGNRGPGGKLIKRCGATGADATYCADQCGGYFGEDYNDNFKYRYFLMGTDTIPSTNPAPILGEEYFPFAPYCLLGCGSATVTGTDRSPSIGGNMKACTASASAGTSAGYSPTVTAGVTAPHTVTLGDWFSYSGTSPTPAPVSSGTGPSPAPAPTPPATTAPASTTSAGTNKAAIAGILIFCPVLARLLDLSAPTKT